jgi:hypothetical protein
MSKLISILTNRWGNLTVQVSPDSVGIRTTDPAGAEAWFYFELQDAGEVAALEELIRTLQAIVPASHPQ